MKRISLIKFILCGLLSSIVCFAAEIKEQKEIKEIEQIEHQIPPFADHTLLIFLDDSEEGGGPWQSRKNTRSFIPST